jgi:hypothetical protein
MDQVSDSGYTQLHEIHQLYGEMPEYVKSASVSETFSPQGLTANSYADIIGKRFPVHTKAACYVSALYFIENQSQLPKSAKALVADRISKVAKQHGIFDDIQKAVHRSSELAKQATAISDDDYVIPEERRYPIKNAAEVRAAASYLDRYRSEFPLKDRMDMAARVLRKAAELQVDLGDLEESLHKQAGLGTYDSREVANQLNFRMVMAPEGSVREALFKVSNEILANPQLAANPGAIREMASSIDFLDRAAGIKYGSTIRPPEDFMFEVLFKSATELVKNSFATSSGSVYSKDQLSELTRDDVADMWGEKVASDCESGIKLDVEKLATLVSSLPWREALLLDEYMRGHGQEPIKSSQAFDIHADERQKLVAEYSTSN